MKKNLVIDEDVVKNNSLYKKVNDIKKEKETEKQNDIIRRRKSIIVSFFLILITIGFINFLSSISRFDNARILDKIVKQATILGVSFIVFFVKRTRRRAKQGGRGRKPASCLCYFERIFCQRASSFPAAAGANFAKRKDNAKRLRGFRRRDRR